VRFASNVGRHRMANPSPNRVRRVNVPHQFPHTRGGLDAKPLAKQAPTEPMLAYRLGDVPLGEVDTDNRAMRTFAQRLAGYRHESDIERVPESTGSREPLAENIEGGKPKLPEPFALEHDPVLVPIGQQVTRECRGIDVDIVRDAAEDLLRQLLHLSQVDGHVRTERELLPTHLDQPLIAPVESPERRTEVGLCPLLRTIEPQRTCDVGPLNRTTVESDEDDDALGAHGKAYGRPITHELERVKELHAGAG
jgi:hypothetical protein